MNAIGIEALTVPSLLAALDAAQLRQQVIATNVARAGEPGRQPLRVTFEQALASTSAGHRASLQPTILPAASSALDGLVRLDEELVAMARNATHQQALLRVLDQHLGVIALAIGEGRR